MYFFYFDVEKQILVFNFLLARGVSGAWLVVVLGHFGFLKKSFLRLEKKITGFEFSKIFLEILFSEPEDTVEPHGKPCLHFIKFCWHTLSFWPQDLGDARSEDAGRKCPEELWYKR